MSKTEPTLVELLAAYGRVDGLSPLMQLLQQRNPSLPSASLSSRRGTLSERGGLAISELLSRVPGVSGDLRDEATRANKIAQVLPYLGVEAPQDLREAAINFGNAQRDADLYGQAAAAGSGLMAAAGIIPGFGAEARGTKAGMTSAARALEGDALSVAQRAKAVVPANMVVKAVEPTVSPRMASMLEAGAGPSLAVNPKGIIAYHGSPHMFDKFSMDKIGTGEGFQVYGHGLYFAENEGVAREYRDALKKGVNYQGRGYPGADNDLAAKKVADQMVKDRNPADVINNEIVKFRAAAKDMRAPARISYSLQVKEANEALAKSYEKIVSDMEKLNPKDFAYDSGSMYRVRIDADPVDFLDYDAPLSRQNRRIRDVAAPRLEQLRAAGAQFGDNIDGAYLARVFSPQSGIDKINFSVGPAAQSSARLREAGIPGIKYFDQVSRNLPPYKRDVYGTRNLVMFDDDLINILKRYRKGGRVSSLAVKKRKR